MCESQKIQLTSEQWITKQIALLVQNTRNKQKQQNSFLTIISLLQVYILQRIGFQLMAYCFSRLVLFILGNQSSIKVHDNTKIFTSPRYLSSNTTKQLHSCKQTPYQRQSNTKINLIRNQITIQSIQHTTYQRLMGQRKIWKAQEDNILKQLFEHRQITQWSLISQIMRKQFGIEGRNGKQCRERYHNHLKVGISKNKWSQQEEKLLIQLHTLHGNRWALISKLIPGRSQNCVKNMLYSRMRRSLRHLNTIIFSNYRHQLKQIKISFIYRLIDFTEKAYKKTEKCRSDQENISIRLKNCLLNLQDLAGEAEVTFKNNDVKQLIEDIHTFKRVNQHYRSRNKSKKSTSNARDDFEQNSVDQCRANEEKTTNSILNLEECSQGSVMQHPNSLSLKNIIQNHCAEHIVISSPNNNNSLHQVDRKNSYHPFLEHNEEILQRQIPIDFNEQKSSSWKEINNGPTGLDFEVNGWQAYLERYV